MGDAVHVGAHNFELKYLKFSTEYINKLKKHKMWTMKLSFQNTKNMLSSIKIQGEKGKNQ